MKNYVFSGCPLNNAIIISSADQMEQQYIEKPIETLEFLPHEQCGT